MNIIALSLGLVPVPPLPPESMRRQHLAEQRKPPREQAARVAGPGFKSLILQMLRDTGSASASDIAVFFGQELAPVKNRLALLHDAGQNTVNAMLAHSRKSGKQRARKPLAKHAKETLK